MDRPRTGVTAMTEAEIIAAFAKLFNGKTLRVVKPGDMVTMDYREDRLTIRIDGNGKIESVSIG
jgi:hypothetical protein